jgi:FkbM family methyltransferase
MGLQVFPIRTIIDVGANEGQFASYISRWYPNAHIFSFEPLSVPFRKLDGLAKRDDRITAVNCALGEKVESLEMYFHSDHSPSSSILPATLNCISLYPQTRNQEKSLVSVTTLDEWASEYHDELQDDVLIKLDVQGFEDRVIRGGPKTFARSKACIVEVCIDHLYSGQGDFVQIAVLLFGLGYFYVGNLNQVYGENGRVLYLDAVFVRQ